MLARLPQGAMSRAFGRIADTPLARPLRSPVIGAFARLMHIDATEAEKPIGEYGSINDFFVRRLRTGVRTIDQAPNILVSPVDGVIGQTGRIANGALVQAKGRSYSAAALLGAQDAASFEGGTFITIYLSPRHYHRIHSPVDGVIDRAEHLPGALLPVNRPSVMHIDQLFPRNERLACHMRTDDGAVAVVAVGAYNVGRISAAFDPAWRDGGSVTNRRGALREERRYAPPIAVKRGQEIMAFHLGSTIVMVTERPLLLDESLAAGSEVRMGEGIASCI